MLSLRLPFAGHDTAAAADRFAPLSSANWLSTAVVKLSTCQPVKCVKLNLDQLQLSAPRAVAPRIAFSGREGPAKPSGPRREAIRSPHRRANIEVGRSPPIASIGHGHTHIQAFGE
jgi:hypothetical protein